MRPLADLTSGRCTNSQRPYNILTHGSYLLLSSLYCSIRVFSLEYTTSETLQPSSNTYKLGRSPISKIIRVCNKALQTGDWSILLHDQQHPGEYFVDSGYIERNIRGHATAYRYTREFLRKFIVDLIASLPHFISRSSHFPSSTPSPSSPSSTSLTSHLLWSSSRIHPSQTLLSLLPNSILPSQGNRIRQIYTQEHKVQRRIQKHPRAWF